MNDFGFDKNWHLHPLAGDTGQSYMGINQGQKVFIKKNASPFLAALTKEGLAPRLVWTRRVGSGDVIIAQEWLDAKGISKKEIANCPQTMAILKKLHRSDSLTSMLYRLGGREVLPTDFLQEYEDSLPKELADHFLLQDIFYKLSKSIPEFNPLEICACHGDVNHKNWLQADNGRIFLVDWDSAKLGDPIIDVGLLLCRYVSRERWRDWLVYYGLIENEKVLHKISWYGLVQQLLHIKRRFELKNQEDLIQEIEILEKIYQKNPI